MKKNNFIPGLLLLLFLASAACHKIEIEQNLLKNGFADNKTCVIKSFDRQLADPNGLPSHYVFTYDSKRNPIAITPDVDETGTPSYKFYYDKKGRLITMAQVYLNNAFQQWDNYSYDQHDRIIGDSNYNFGTVGQLPGRGMTYFSSFAYDNLNRVSMITTNVGEQPFFPPRVGYFNYDPAGNQLSSPYQNTQYDNKANILLTNKIWRFLNLNYSVNNPVGALAYNDHQLPILFPNTNSLGDFTLIPNELVQGASITYDCQEDLIPDK